MSSLNMSKFIKKLKVVFFKKRLYYYKWSGLFEKMI